MPAKKKPAAKKAAAKKSVKNDAAAIAKKMKAKAGSDSCVFC